MGPMRRLIKNPLALLKYQGGKVVETALFTYQCQDVGRKDRRIA